MTNQVSKSIDLTQGYIPVDPMTFPYTPTLYDTGDARTSNNKPRVYEGLNFMPTTYGVKSYFADDGILDCDQTTIRPSKIDRIVSYQTATKKIWLIAMALDGIWKLEVSTPGSSWEQLAPPQLPLITDTGIFLPWSYAIIENKLFMYQANCSILFRLQPTSFTTQAGQVTLADNLTQEVPTFLNMAGQIAIFKAGSRLGFFDSLNSIAWSTIDSFTDFTPSILGAAGSAIFQEISGNIISILPAGDGFIVYATKSIVSIRRDIGALFQWNPSVVLKGTGISYYKQATVGLSETTQYAYTGIGLIAITGDRAEQIHIEVSDFLRESNKPLFVQFIDNRYLVLNVLDDRLINGRVSYKKITSPTITLNPGYNFPAIVYNADDYSLTQNEINRLFTGDNSSLQALADRFRRSQTLPAPATKYTFNWQASDSNYRFVPNEAESNGILVSLIRDVTGASVLWLPKKFNFPGMVTTGLIFNGNIPIGTSSPATIYTNQLQTGTSSYSVDTVGPIYKGLQYAYFDSGADQSTVLSLVDPFAHQSTTWQANDSRVVDILGAGAALAISAFDKAANSAFGILSHFDTGTAVGEVYIADASDSSGMEYPQLLIQPPDYSPSFANIYSSDRLYQDFEPPVVISAITVPSAWSQPVAKWNSASLTFTMDRYATQVTEHRLTTKKKSVLLGHQNYPYSLAPGNGILADIYRQEITASSQLVSTITKEEAIRLYGSSWSLNNVATDYKQNLTAALANITYLGVEGQFHTFLPVVGAMPMGRSAISQPPLYYPETSFILSTGVAAPAFPIFRGSLILDTILKKWGQQSGDYRLLIDWSPTNNTSGNVVNSNDRHNIQVGMVKEDGLIYRLGDGLDTSNSYIRIGKIGYTRHGMTSCEEIHLYFRVPFIGLISVEGSLDGTFLDEIMTKVTDVAEPTMQVVLYPSTVARWHSIVIEGKYDLAQVEFRGSVVGNK